MSKLPLSLEEHHSTDETHEDVVCSELAISQAPRAPNHTARRGRCFEMETRLSACCPLVDDSGLEGFYMSAKCQRGSGVAISRAPSKTKLLSILNG